MTDERYKQIMADIPWPNSQSILGALRQVANEVAQETTRKEREASQFLRDSMLAAYASIQTKEYFSAKEFLIVGLEGGNVNNPLDFCRCVKTWNDRVVKKKVNAE